MGKCQKRRGCCIPCQSVLLLTPLPWKVAIASVQWSSGIYCLANLRESSGLVLPSGKPICLTRTRCYRHDPQSHFPWIMAITHRSTTGRISSGFSCSTAGITNTRASSVYRASEASAAYLIASPISCSYKDNTRQFSTQA